MHLRGEPYQPVENPVGSHEDAVQIGVFRDPLQLRNSAHIFRVGADYINRLVFDQILEVLPEVNLFPGVNAGGSRLGEFFEQLGVR